MMNLWDNAWTIQWSGLRRHEKKLSWQFRSSLVGNPSQEFIVLFSYRIHPQNRLK